MKVAEYAGWLLELSRKQGHDGGVFYCWLSMPTRCIIGCAKAATEEEAIDAALAESKDDIPSGMAETLARMAKSYLKLRPYCGAAGHNSCEAPAVAPDDAKSAAVRVFQDACELARVERTELQ